MSQIDDRLLEAVRAIIRAELERLTFSALWEYSVTSTTIEDDVVLFDGQPTSTAFPLPAAVKWPCRFGIAGAQFEPPPGSRVLVAFANADPSRPLAVVYDGEVPDEVLLGAGLGRPLREGDTMTLTGVQSGASATGVTALVTLGLPNPDEGGVPEASRVKL